MPAATALKEREEIVRRRKEHESFAHISREMAIAYATVRNVWHHYQNTGQLEPSYERCSHRGVRKKQDVYEKAIEFKRAHPSWGAGLIWVELAELFEEEELPSLRSLQRWFHRAGLVKRESQDKRPQIQLSRGEKPHEVWAMDAKEQMTLADGTHASWLVISDEGSGALLHGELFPHQALESGESSSRQKESPRGVRDMGTPAEDTG